MGMGFSEILLLVFFFGAQHNLSVPVGVPPAEEVQLMSDVAPEDCLFYASWATAGSPDAAKNASERWLAQERIQKLWKQVLGSLDESSTGDAAEPFERDLAALSKQIIRQALVRATAVFVENGAAFDKLTGGGVIHLEQDAVRKVGDLINSLKTTMPEEWHARELTVEGNRYLAFTMPESPLEIAVGLRGQFAIIGVGPDAIAKIEQKVRTPEPTWLAELKKQLPVARRSSMSRIDVRGLCALLKAMPADDFPDEVRRAFFDILKLDSIQTYDSVCGLDDQGFVSRSQLKVEGKRLEGLLSVFDVPPLTTSAFEKMANQRGYSAGVRLSSENLLALLRQLFEIGGENFEEPFVQFKDTFGLDLRKDLIEYLDGTILAQGNFDNADPTAGLTLMFGVADEMSLFDNYEAFNEKLGEYLEESESGVSLKTEEVEGVKIYSIKSQDGMFFIPLPVWNLHGGQLCLGMDQATMRKRVKASEPTLAQDAAFQKILQELPAGSTDRLVGFSRIDMAQLIELMVSMSSLLDMLANDAPPGSVPFDFSDLPSKEILTNGVEPSISFVFRTDDGFETYARQTIPGAASGATVASFAAMMLPAVAVARTAALQVDSTNRMRQIMLALHNYHDAYGGFPAQFNKDKTGKPLLSWRVHILPFLEQQELYDQFHLDEPWDSEHNIKLVEKMPHTYVHPKLKLEPGRTVYLGLQGKDTVWLEPKDVKQQPVGMNLEKVAVGDGTSRTAALLEVPADQAVIWTKPEDFDVDVEGFAEKLKPTWNDKFLVALTDAAIFKFRADMTEDDWRHLFHFHDGEPKELEPLTK